MSSARITDLLDALDKPFGLHPGLRPGHAKGLMCSGTFKTVSINMERARTEGSDHECE
jgi:hypothetical protein